MRSPPSITIAAALIATIAMSPALADVRCGPSAANRVGVAPPPPLPETGQPPMPAYGYVWTPGSWLWNPDVNDYYWAPGAWILPPAVGLFWTPGYWAWDDGTYLYNAGYWGPHVGFYGGISYGFGYWGHGYDGGYWRDRTFFYNRAYNNIGGLHINALYDHRVPEDRHGGRTSFSGGPGGVAAAKRADETLADRDPHIAATNDQVRHSQSAAGDRALRASVNHGHPVVAGAARAPGHVAAARAEATHAGAAHADLGREARLHSIHASTDYRREVSVQPRQDAGYGHYAPAYRAPPREAPRPFHVEPQHFASPRPGPAREDPPHGAEGGRPH